MLSDTQLNLLAQSMEMGLLVQQRELVRNPQGLAVQGSRNRKNILEESNDISIRRGIGNPLGSRQVGFRLIRSISAFVEALEARPTKAKRAV